LNVYVFYISLLSFRLANENEIPFLELRLNYLDISNKWYEKKIHLATKLFMMGTIAYSGEFTALEHHGE